MKKIFCLLFLLIMSTCVNSMVYFPVESDYAAEEQELYFFHLAARMNAEEFKKALETAPDEIVNALAKKTGKNALHLVALFSRDEDNSQNIMALLQDPRVDPNIPDSDGKTALYYASLSPYPNVIAAFMNCPWINPLEKWGCKATLLHSMVNNTLNSKEPVNALLSDPCVNPNAQNSDGRTALHCALTNLSKQHIAELLLSNPHIRHDIADNTGDTPLHFASKYASGTIRTLLKRGANADTKNSMNQLPLHLTTESPWADIDEQSALLQATTDPNCVDFYGETPLHRAAYKDLKTVQLLLQDPRVKPNIKNTRGSTPLHNAVIGNNQAAVETLLKDGRLDPNTQDNNGRTPLHRALETQSRERCAQLLLSDSRIQYNVPNNAGNTALHLATQLGSAEIITLLQHKANANIQNLDKQLPLHIAAQSSWNDQAKQSLLLHATYDPNVADSEGATPLHIAAMKNLTMVQLLLCNHRVNLNAQDAQGNTPLHCAICSNNINIVKTFLEGTHIDANIRNKAGLTPLLFALLTPENNEDIALFLINNPHIDVTATDQDGNTPLHYATTIGTTKMISALLQRTSATNAENNRGKTPTDYAKDRKDPNIAKLIAGCTEI